MCEAAIGHPYFTAKLSKSNLEDTKTNFIDSNLFCFGTCQTKILQFYVFQSGQCKNKAGESMHSNM